jgi:hypothetical protein
MGNPVVGERHDDGEDERKCSDRTDAPRRCQEVLSRLRAMAERGRMIGLLAAVVIGLYGVAPEIEYVEIAEIAEIVDDADT